MTWHLRTLKWMAYSSLTFVLLLMALIGGGLFYGMAVYSRSHPLNLTPYLPRAQAVLAPYGLHINASYVDVFFDDSPVIRVSDFSLRGADNQLAVVAEKLAVKLANRRLFTFQISPKIIEADNLTLKIINTSNGLTVSGIKASSSVSASPDTPDGTLEWLNSLTSSTLWGRLKNVKVQGLTVILDDKTKRATWALEDGRLALTRYPDDGERGSLTGQVRRLNGAPRADGTVPIVPILLTFDHPAGTDTATLRAQLDQADVAMVADYFPKQFKDLLKAQGEMEMGTQLLPQNRLGQPWVTLRMGPMALQLPQGFSKPLSFQKLAITASYSPPVSGISTSDILTLHEVDATLARGNRFLVSGTISNLTTDPALSLSLHSPEGNIQGIFDLFPDQEEGFQKALEWLRPNIISSTYGNLSGHYIGKPSAFPNCGDACGDIAIDATINAGTVHFLPHIPPATLTTSGTFSWRGQQFTVMAPQAIIGAQQASHVSVTLNNLFVHLPTHVVVTGQIKGETANLMQHLHGLDAQIPATFSGLHTAMLHVDVPMVSHTEPSFASALVTVSGTVKNATARGLDGLEKDMFKTPLAVVSIDAAKNLRVQATGDLISPQGRTLASTKADVLLNLQPHVKTPLQVSLNGPMDGQALLKRLGSPQGISLTGFVNVAVNLVQQPDKILRFGIRADAMGAKISIPNLAFTKPAKESLVLETQGEANLAGRLALKTLRVFGKQANISGLLDYTPTNLDAVTLKLAPFRLGKTDATVDIAAQKSTIQGKILDLTGMDFVSDDGTPPRLKNMSIALNIKEMPTRRARFQDVDARLSVSNGKWDVARFVARVAGGGGVALRTTQLGGGRHKLSINIDDAGQTLAGLGLYENLAKGKLWGEVLYTTPKTASGILKMEGFELKNPPILMSLLGLMSLQQLVAGTDSTLFDHAVIPLHINGNIITLQKAILEGPSMSIQLDGTYNRDVEEMDFDGRLAPAIPFNRLVTKIPLVGTLLAGSQDGVVVADFKLKGKTDAPDIHVRPLSVLTPGLVKDMWRGVTSVFASSPSPTKYIPIPKSLK